VKSQLSREKKASSALLFAIIGWLVASFSPAFAITGERSSQDVPKVKSSAQGFLPSTNLVKVSEDRAKSVQPPSTVTAISSHISAPVTPVSSTELKGTPVTNVENLTIPVQKAEAIANPVITTSESPDSPVAEESMDQITNVSELSDVKPSDWAYSALRELVERYGCISGYPDGFFRGNRSLSRYEFAAGVNSCLKQIERLLPSRPQEGASQQDLESLRRLTQEFQAELTALSDRTDKLEGRTQFLENRQFSTTTKLFGQAVFGVQGHTSNRADLIPVDGVKESNDPFTSINMVSTAQLSLFTQLTERSILLTGLAAGSGFTGSLYNTYTSLAYEGNTNGRVSISDLTYRQLIGNNLAFIVGAVGVSPVNVFRGANRIESAGSGSLSRFAQRNPIVNMGSGGGIGFDWQTSPNISLQGVYSASQIGASSGGGVFGGTNGETALGAQLNIAPGDNFDVALHYINAYSPFGRLGTNVGDDLVAFPTLDPNTGQQRAPLQTNAYGASMEWRISPEFTFGGWGGYTNSVMPGSGGNVETINWMAFMNFPDLFGEGNLGGLYVGQPPRISSSNLTTGRNVPGFFANFLGEPGARPGTTTHVEAFYRMKISDNISITPGAIVIFAPGQTSTSDTITIGVLRTTFVF
jgi:Carbohydrate-selective porin, OprB family/S-layer homology domain